MNTITSEMNKEAHEYAAFATRWYGQVPTRELLPYWISSAAGFYNILTGKANKVSVRLIGDMTLVAKVDSDNRMIDIGGYLFNEQIMRKFSLSQQSRAPFLTAMINGSVIHESAHIAWSPNSLAKLLADTKYRSLDDNIRDPFLFTITNLVEDIFIEAKMQRDFPQIVQFLKAKNLFIFNDDELIQRKETFMHERSAPAALDLLIPAKRGFEYVATDIKAVGMMASILQEATIPMESDDLKKRGDIAIRIYDILIKNFPQPKDKNGTGDDMGSSKGMGKRGEAYAESENTNSLSENNRRAKARYGKPSPEFTRLADDVEALGMAESVHLIHDRIVHVEVPTATGREMAIDERYLKIAKHLRQIKTPATVWGPPTDKGRILPTRLSRIVIDNKVAGEPVLLNRNTKNYDIAVLLDCSGSMLSSGSGIPDRTSKAEKTFRAGMGIKKSLDEIGIRCALWGHAADCEGKARSVTIFRFGANTNNWHACSQRLRFLLDQHAKFCNNADGYAIRWAADNCFTRGNFQKVLIVISDGAPLATGYSGDDAIDHTASQVEYARRKGIIVISISIDKYAIGPNDRIYKRQFNTFNEDPAIITKIVESIITK